jgi:hypothetical protein
MRDDVTRAAAAMIRVRELVVITASPLGMEGPVEQPSTGFEQGVAIASIRIAGSFAALSFSIDENENGREN